MPLLEIPSDEGNWSMEVADPHDAGWQEATITFKKLRNRGNGPARKLFAVMEVNYGPYLSSLPSRFAQNPDDIRVYGRFTPAQIQEIPANEEGVVNFRGRFLWPDPPSNFGGSVTVTITIAASDIEDRRYAASFTFWAQHHVWASSGDGVQLTGPTIDLSSPPLRRPPPEPHYGLKYFTMEPTRLLDFRLGDRDGLVRPEQSNTEDNTDE
jgi:hypothetical protein